MIFALGLVFVFLVLSAQYESFIDPLIVLLAVPAALLGALGFMNLRHLPIPFLFDPSLAQDAYAQVGYVMLIGLGEQERDSDRRVRQSAASRRRDVVQAAMRAAQTRLRPILMTSIAFIIAVRRSSSHRAPAARRGIRSARSFSAACWSRRS